MIRVKEAREILEKRGYSTHWDTKNLILHFEHDLSDVRFDPHTEWWSIEGVTEGRGFKKLLKELW